MNKTRSIIDHSNDALCYEENGEGGFTSDLSTSVFFSFFASFLAFLISFFASFFALIFPSPLHSLVLPDKRLLHINSASQNGLMTKPRGLFFGRPRRWKRRGEGISNAKLWIRTGCAA